jgi:hypothetical protein
VKEERLARLAYHVHRHQPAAPAHPPDGHRRRLPPRRHPTGDPRDAGHRHPGGPGLSTSGALPHFLTHTRRTGKLVDRWNGLTSGGPIKLLDLDGMRTRAAAGAAAEWLLWNQVVDGTRPAQPFWSFADRHRADGQRYPLPRAQADYLAQPRVLAMTAHNAIPGQPCPLPTTHLEAFQAGYGTYVNVAWLAAVPGDGFAPQRGGWLTTRSQRLADLLDYLAIANGHLAQLPRGAHLVAVASPA